MTHLRHARIVPEIFEFSGIGFQIEEFAEAVTVVGHVLEPLATNHRAEALDARQRPVVFAPHEVAVAIGGGITGQDPSQRLAVHRGRNRLPGQLEQGRRDVSQLDQGLAPQARLELARPRDH